MPSFIDPLERADYHERRCDELWRVHDLL